MKPRHFVLGNSVEGTCIFDFLPCHDVLFPVISSKYSLNCFGFLFRLKGSYEVPSLDRYLVSGNVMSGHKWLILLLRVQGGRKITARGL